MALFDVSLGSDNLFLLENTTYEGVIRDNTGQRVLGYPEQVSGLILKVSPAYYQIFGPPAAASGTDSHITTLTITQIEWLLEEPDQISRIRALNTLSQYRQDEFTEQIQMSLYRIFLTEGEEYSLPAASHLSGRMFLRMVTKEVENVETKELIHRFIRERPEGPILLKCIDLIEGAFTSQSTSHHEPQQMPSTQQATSLLLELLARNSFHNMRGIATTALSPKTVSRVIACLVLQW
ncbi:MAG: hypothetical protein ABI406_06500 [Ktedonobacteraceae bacterium]